MTGAPTPELVGVIATSWAKSDEVSVQPLGARTHLLTHGPERAVVRTDPPGRSFRGSAAREHTLLLGADRLPIRAPRAIDVPLDASTSFSLTRYVEGAEPPGDTEGFATDLVDALAEIHRADVTEAVPTSSRDDASIERVLGRWSDRFDEAIHRGRRVAGGKRRRAVREIDLVGRWLRARLPAEQSPSLVHGTFGASRALAGPDGRVRAVTGWMWWGFGDPLVDVGWLLSTWTDDDPLDPMPGASRFTIDSAVQRYEERSGRPIADLRYYRTLGYWLRGVMSEVRYVERLLGNEEDPAVDRLADAVPALGLRARAVIDAG